MESMIKIIFSSFIFAIFYHYHNILKIQVLILLEIWVLTMTNDQNTSLRTAFCTI